MSATCELDYPAETDIAPVSDANICFFIENECKGEPQTTLAFDGRWNFSGMVRVPENISDVIVNRISKIAHVKAILMGRSGDVHHVWTMMNVWSAAERRAVYEAQKDLLTKLKGFELDFYVVGAEEDENPRELVSDIPIIWERAA